MLTKKELELVALLSSSTTMAFGVMNDACRRAVRKAYSDPDDNGEFAREVFAAVKDVFKSGVARFFRRHGLNVTLDGTRHIKSTIGGVLDRSKQNDVFAKLDADVAVQGEVKGRAPRARKELEGFAADRLKKWLNSSIKRMKEHDPDAALLLNEMVQTGDVKTRLAPLAELQLTDAEIRAMVDFAKMMRDNHFDPEEIELNVAAEPMAIAA